MDTNWKFYMYGSKYDSLLKRRMARPMLQRSFYKFNIYQVDKDLIGIHLDDIKRVLDLKKEIPLKLEAKLQIIEDSGELKVRIATSKSVNDYPIKKYLWLHDD